MKRLRCFLTGGHRCSDVTSHCRVVGDEIVCTYICVKCGKAFEVRVPKSAIIPEWMEVDE